MNISILKMGIACLAVLTSTPLAAPIRFAAFGDYGYASTAEQSVSTMVKSYGPPSAEIIRRPAVSGCPKRIWSA